jgi:phosphoenolpyruvate carboxykinase (GTP)
VVEATDWEHGVFLGSTIASERTAAAEGKLGEVRRDPFAMLPFCGYNMGDYFAHWLKMGASLDPGKAPRIFQVNWFRRGADRRFLWPGFGDNSRVLEWIVRRLEGTASAVQTPIGHLPEIKDLNLDGLELPEADVEELFSVDPVAWLDEVDATEQFYSTFGETLPEELTGQLEALRGRLIGAR